MIPFVMLQFGIDIATLVASVWLLVAVFRPLHHKRHSSATLAFAVFGAAIGFFSLTYSARLWTTWQATGWISLAIQLGAIIGLCWCAYRLHKKIPRVILFHDRAQINKAAAELCESKQRFERAVNGSASGLWEWNPADDAVWMAPRFRQMLGYVTEEEFPNTLSSFEHALHPDDKDAVFKALKDHLQQQEPYDVEYRLRTKSGEYRWFSARGLAIRTPDGHPYLMSGSIQDIHQRKLAELTVRRLQEYNAHKHKLETLGELASGLAHEFNNVLQAISGQIQIAESLIESDAIAVAELSTAEELITQASQFTRRLLAYSHHGDSSQQRLHPADIVTQLSAFVRPLVGRNIEVTINREGETGHVFADPVALQQALMNLCINARDAMPNGGTLTLSLGRRELNESGSNAHPGSKPGWYVTFGITDTGCGIPADQRDRIFEPFFTTKGRDKGTGLGLSIAINAVEENGGFIELESDIGQGTKFTIGLPEIEQRKLKCTFLPEPTSAPRPASRTILYAEDDQYTRRNTIRVLQDSGFQVEEACDGKQALTIFEKLGDQIQVALLDVSMPHMDGLELFQHLRAIRPQLPIVFTTASISPLNAKKVLDQPNTFLVQKPYGRAELFSAIDQSFVSMSHSI